MREGTVDAPLIPFAFMGCWNRELRDSTTGKPLRDGPRERVAAAIREAGIPTVILGGDNIYTPHVQTSSGTEYPLRDYDITAFRRGAALYVGAPQLFVAVGNHNVDPAPFPIYEEQQRAFGPDSLPASYYARTFSDGLRLIVIDTNLTVPSRDAEFQEMRRWLATQITQGPYILVQHEPFLCFGVQKKEIKKRPMLPRGPDLLDLLIQHPPLLILCADTHNAQVGMIRYRGVEIPQIVMGTGGGRPDPMFPLATDGSDLVYTPPHLKGQPLSYELIAKADGYGYLRVDRRPGGRMVFGGLRCSFVPVVPWFPPSSQGGGRGARRTKRAPRSRSTWRTKTRAPSRGE